MTKTISGDFDKLKNKLINNENFSFSRFCDGELFILENRRLELNPDHLIIGEVFYPNQIFEKDEQKQFIPGEHEFYRKKLEESLKYINNNFYRGICMYPDVGGEVFKWMVEFAGGDHETLTWANLFINGNYPRFIEEILPIFSNKPVVMVVNENADLEGLPFEVYKDFRVGKSCFTNDYSLSEELKRLIINDNINDFFFLFSAASLSNLLIHDLHVFRNSNTYIDIGSSLNPLMRLDGWKHNRYSLMEYWLGRERHFLNYFQEWR
jgi:hypothetical protein